MIRIRILQKPVFWIGLAFTLPLAPILMFRQNRLWFVDDWVRINANARRILDRDFPWPTKDISKDLSIALRHRVSPSHLAHSSPMEIWMNQNHLISLMHSGLCPELAD